MHDRRGLKPHKSNVFWIPGPEAKGMLQRALAEAEKADVVQVVREKGLPAYVVYQGRIVRPRDLWRCFRLVMDGKTGAPEDTERRVKEAFKRNLPHILTSGDCIIVLAEWSNRSWLKETL